MPALSESDCEISVIVNIVVRVCYVATFCGRLKLYILYHISDYFKQFNSSLIDKIQFSSELGASSGLCIHRTFKT